MVEGACIPPDDDSVERTAPPNIELSVMNQIHLTCRQAPRIGHSSRIHSHIIAAH